MYFFTLFTPTISVIIHDIIQWHGFKKGIRLKHFAICRGRLPLNRINSDILRVLYSLCIELQLVITHILPESSSGIHVEPLILLQWLHAVQTWEMSSLPTASKSSWPQIQHHHSLRWWQFQERQSHFPHTTTYCMEMCVHMCILPFTKSRAHDCEPISSKSISII